MREWRWALKVWGSKGKQLVVFDGLRLGETQSVLAESSFMVFLYIQDVLYKNYRSVLYCCLK